MQRGEELTPDLITELEQYRRLFNNIPAGSSTPISAGLVGSKVSVLGIVLLLSRFWWRAVCGSA